MPRSVNIYANLNSCQLLSVSSSTFCVPPMTARDCVLCVVRGLITPRVRRPICFSGTTTAANPPSNHAANLTNLLRNHLSSNLLPPMRQFMKWNPILVLKKEVPYQSLLSIHHLMQFNNRFRTSWWHIYKIDENTKDLLVCNVYGNIPRTSKHHVIWTSLKPSTDNPLWSEHSSCEEKKGPFKVFGHFLQILYYIN